MTQTIRFNSHNCYGLGMPLTVEDIFRLYGSQAGIHDFSFDEMISSPKTDAEAALYWRSTGVWGGDTTPPTATFNSGGFVLPTSTNAYVFATKAHVPQSYLATFIVGTAWPTKVYLSAPGPSQNDIAGVYVLLPTAGHSAGISVVREQADFNLTAGHTETTEGVIWSELEGFTNGAVQGGPQIRRSHLAETYNVAISVRYVRFGDSNDSAYYFLRVWINEVLVVSMKLDGGAPYVYGTTSPALTYFYRPWSFGFGYPPSGTSALIVRDFRISEMTDFLDWASLDPGEAPTGGLDRAIEGRNLRYFIRADGSLRAFRPKATASAKTFTAPEVEKCNQQFDARQLVSHVRMVGAYTQSEYLDDYHPYAPFSAQAINIRTPNAQAMGGHRFRVDNNPYLMTAIDCYKEAINSVQRSKQQAVTGMIQVSGAPLLEREDVITVDPLPNDYSETALLPETPPGGVYPRADPPSHLWYINDFSVHCTAAVMDTTYNLRGYFPLIP